MAPYSNPAFDKIVLRAARQFDSKLRAKEITKAYRALHEDVGAIPIWSAVKTLTMRSDVNYVPASSETVRLVNVSWNKES
jgi:ABC-type transport system substrate-binding protein